jgi:hypothetical protein
VAFTYDLTSIDPLELEISQLRLELGDTVEGKGVRATGGNITDAELTYLMDQYGVLGDDGRVLKGIAAACAMLARDWSRVASTTVGSRSSQYGAIAQQWADRAREAAAAAGLPAGGFAFSVAPHRADGYAANAELDDFV